MMSCRSLRLAPAFGLLAALFASATAGFDYSVEWNGNDDEEKQMASGVYYYTLNAGDSVQTRRLTLVR
jgi:hypothetical protein